MLVLKDFGHRPDPPGLQPGETHILQNITCQYFPTKQQIEFVATIALALQTNSIQPQITPLSAQWEIHPPAELHAHFSSDVLSQKADACVVP